MFTSVIPNEIILNIYPYGSRVYGTNTESSDYDYIVVVAGMEGKKSEIKNNDYNITIYDEKAFLEQIQNHEISVLECLSLPKNTIVQEFKSFDCILDLTKLRHSISEKASNSFVKAKKKLIVEKDFDPYIGRKSLFHSLRILMFGIQLAKYGKIVDFSAANHFWYEINDIISNEWEPFKEKYQPIYNNLATEFRILAPK